MMLHDLKLHSLSHSTIHLRLSVHESIGVSSDSNHGLHCEASCSALALTPELPQLKPVML